MAVTLVDQSAGLAGLTPAVDAEPATSEWRSVVPFRDDVVTLYRAGRTVNAIAVELGIAWSRRRYCWRGPGCGSDADGMGVSWGARLRLVILTWSLRTATVPTLAMIASIGREPSRVCSLPSVGARCGHRRSSMILVASQLITSPRDATSQADRCWAASIKEMRLADGDEFFVAVQGSCARCAPNGNG